MLSKTNMDKVKDLACAMLYMEIERTALSPIVVKHPFTDTGISAIKKEGQFTVALLLDSKEDLLLWQNQVKYRISASETPLEIANMVTNSYALAFLKFALPFLSKADYSEILRHVWITMESPNRDPNFTKKQMVKLFQNADPHILMDDEERDTLNTLPEMVKIYRGVTSHNHQNIKALSWTLRRATAEWFAGRFGEKGTVYEAQIPKASILAYFQGRDEAEAIIDPTKITNLKKSI